MLRAFYLHNFIESKLQHHTVYCWQELLGEQTAQVTVTEGSLANFNFKYHNKSSAERSS